MKGENKSLASLRSVAALKPVPPTLVVLEIKSALDLLQMCQHGPERQEFLNEARIELTVLRAVFENHVDLWSSFEKVRAALEAIYDPERTANEAAIKQLSES